ncbi:nitrite extrusion protein 2 [Escherichia coli]|uniref:Nitrite extrusion protein 2 n=1 Tax=Escherichia coli TaxID=562 RepID=A0A376KUC1_ECOLX|nr:nitrite extrusion protein 2 [Escherichia coli]
MISPVHAPQLPTSSLSYNACISAAEPALPCHLRFVYRFFCGFAMLAKTQFPDVNILRLAFFGPFIGASARSVGGAISDKFGGVRVTLINFIFMAIFSALLFLTLPGTGSGNFIAFYAVFMGAVSDCGSGKWFYFPDDRRHLSPDNHLSGKDERR